MPLKRQEARDKRDRVKALNDRLDELGVERTHPARSVITRAYNKLDRAANKARDTDPDPDSDADDDYARAVNAAQVTIKGVEETQTRDALERRANDAASAVGIYPRPSPPESPPADAGGTSQPNKTK